MDFAIEIFGFLDGEMLCLVPHCYESWTLGHLQRLFHQIFS